MKFESLNLKNEEFTPEKKKEILDNLLKVGPNKPVGYLPLSTLENMKINVQELQHELEDRGITTIILNPDESNVGSGALYAYDKESLRQLLQKNELILKKSNWPTDPDSFILYLKNNAWAKTNLFNVIADAFGDYKNRGRKILIPGVF